jgi:O-antigen/teichoic acid export membrane protein
VSRAHRTARNSLYSFAGFAYATVLTIAVIPVVVHRLGAEAYGVLALTGTFAGFLGLLNIGLGTTLLRFLADRFAKDDHDEANEIFGTSLVFYGAIGLIGMAIAVVVGTTLTASLFNLSAANVPAARFAFVVGGLGFLLVMITKPFTILLLSVQRYDIQARVGIALGTVSAVGSIALVLAGYRLYALVLLQLGIDLAALIVYTSIGRRLLPTLRARPRWNTPVLRRMISFSAFLFVASVSGFVLAELDRILIGALASVTLLSFYVIPLSVASRISSAITTIASVVVPASTELIAQDDFERARRLYVRATRVVVVFLLALSIPTFVFAHELLLHWIGPAMAAKSDTILRLLVVTFVLSSLAVVPYNTLVGAGNPRVPAYFNVGMAVINVALVVILIPVYDITGAAVAYLISAVPFLAMIWFTEQRVLGIRPSPWPGLAVRLLVPIALQIVAAYALRPLASNLATVIFAMLLAVAVLPAAYYLLGLAEPEDRQLLVSLVRGAG